MSIEGPFLLRVPVDGIDTRRGQFVASTSDKHENSLRHVRPVYSIGDSHVSARAVAKIAWQINALERWLGLTVTPFRVRDRVTHDPYELDTLPFPWDPNAGGDPWFQVIDHITEQLLSGGPGGRGCNRFYMHELLSTARTALDQVHAVMWHAPPDGPGAHGAIYGTRRTHTVQGYAGPITFSITPSEGNFYPVAPNAVQFKNSTDWDYRSGQPDPLGRTYYLPLDRYLPLGDWSGGHFELLRFRGGTTVNANHWPPDIQVLGDFGCRSKEILVQTKASTDDLLRGATASTVPLLFAKLTLADLAGRATDSNPVPGWTFTIFGFDNALTGPVWQLNLWEWIVYRLGYVPRRLHAQGSMEVSILRYTINPAVGESRSRFSMGCSILGTQLGEFDDESTLTVPPQGSSTEVYTHEFGPVDLTQQLRQAKTASISVEYEPEFEMLPGHHHEHSFSCGVELVPVN